MIGFLQPNLYGQTGGKNEHYKRTPKKGFAGLEIKKTGIFYSPKGFEMAERKAPEKPKVPVIAEGGIVDFGWWTLNQHGLLTITGSGQMPNFRWDDVMHSTTAPWWRVKDEIKAARISNGVTSVGEYSFYDCKNLTCIIMPDGVICIGKCSFTSCMRLSGLVIPCTVTRIGEKAFAHCQKLIHLIIPNTVTTIEAHAFDDCVSLIHITIAKTERVSTIQRGAFFNCESLISFTIPGSVTKIGGSAFAYCESLTNLEIPNSVTTIGMGAFLGCRNLRRVKMPTRFNKLLFESYYGISKDIVEFT